MGSKVVAFRVPVDLAEELERASRKLGQTTTEFLRKLVDDTLYPLKGDSEVKLGESHQQNLLAVNESFRQTIENYNKKMNDFEEKLSKLHICPDCGASLHSHRLEKEVKSGSEKYALVQRDEKILLTKKAGEERWHLECPLCGYCSKDYPGPDWKKTRGDYFALTSLKSKGTTNTT